MLGHRSLVAGALLLIAGCGSAPPAEVLKKIGEACTADTDCGSTLYDMPEAMVCMGGVCTRPCTRQVDCPQGFDCGFAHPGDATPSCYPSPVNPMTGGFGTDCSIIAADPAVMGGPGCSVTENPCATGFSCHSTQKCDPTAYCTKSCAGDTDCPPQFYCAVDASTMDKFCRKRDFCLPCISDDNCPMSWRCSTSPMGEHFCAKPCGADSDCPQPQNGASYFEKCIGKVCVPAPPEKGNGKPNECHGPSSLKGFPANGICSGCRPGVPSDCPNGGICFQDQFTLERFCTQKCKLTVDGGGNVTADSCPTGSYCAIGPVPKGTYDGICSADNSYSGPTCYP